MARPLLLVNINKYALLRNSRGHDAPNIEWAIDTCLAAGAHGITIHPRSDERHIRFSDIERVSRHMKAHHPGVELNIECEPVEDILSRVHDVCPAQCTLVPVTPGEVTSDHGWSLPEEHDRLVPVIADLKKRGIRVSIFMDPDPELMAAAAAVGTDRVELYTGLYAWAWGKCEQERERQRI